MAKYGSDDVAIFEVGGYHVLGATTEILFKVMRLLEETTVLGDTWEQQELIGLRKAEFSQKGFFDDATNGAHTALKALAGTDRVLVWAIEGNAIGQGYFAIAGGLQADYERILSLGRLHRANAAYAVNGAPRVDGKILAARAARTADGNTEASSVDNGAASANGGYAHLSVSAFTLGTATNLAVHIRHSTDNAVWATKASFTVVAAGPTAEEISIAGTINRYAAASWVWTGGAGGGSTATFVVGLVRS